VVVDPVLVRVVLREVAGGDPAGGEAPPSSRRLPLIMSPVRAASVIAPYSHLIAPYSRPAANGPHELSVQLQIPKLGVTVWDDAPRELLCLSLRGLRFASRRGATPDQPRTHAVAVASIQLDYQGPVLDPSRAVLLRAGVSTRRDALSLQSDHSERRPVTVLHQVVAICPEIDLRLDEEIITSVATSVLAAASSSAADPALSGSAVPPVLETTVATDVRGLAREPSSSVARLYLQDLRLHQVKLRLSLRLAPRSRGVGASGAGASSMSLLLTHYFRLLGSTLLTAEQMPVKLPAVSMKGVLLPSLGGIGLELGQRYGRALLQQAYKLLPSSTALGDPYGLLRKLQKGWTKHVHEMRRSSWRRLPAVLARAAGHLLQATVSNALRAGGQSVQAITTSLAASLLENSEEQLFLLEATLRGVGGLARETAKAATFLHANASSAIVARVGRAGASSMPFALECALLTGVLPIAFLHGLRHALLMGLVGSLSSMRTSLDAFRALVKGVELGRLTSSGEPGRARAPRVMQERQLLAPLCDGAALARGEQVLSSMEEQLGRTQTLLHVVEAVDAEADLLLTSTRLVLVSGAAPLAPLWTAELTHVLITHLRGDVFCVLVQEHREDGSLAAEPARREVRCPSVAAAAALHELVRVARLNAGERPFPTPAADVRRPRSLTATLQHD